jgi:uncharacterized membrane protein
VTIFVLALWLGVICGLRTMMGPTALSWAAYSGRLSLGGTPLALVGYAWTPWLFTLLALGELVVDQLPTTPSRTVPMQFGARLISGSISGAAIGAAGGSLIGGLLAGLAGAVIGTLGGRAVRARLASHFRRDPPAAFIEDAVAIVGALLIILALP